MERDQWYRGQPVFDKVTRKFNHSIRWTSKPTGAYLATALLVESVRTPAGPRQRLICYLGTIEEGTTSCSARHRFWLSADGNLAKAGVVGDDLARVVATLEAAVPRPDRARLDREWALCREMRRAELERADRRRLRTPPADAE
jgi:hypothetical protein